MDERFYPGVLPRWDDRLFRELVESNLQPHHNLLDVGAGAGIIELTNYRGQVQSVCGVDPDERVLTNPNLDEGKIAFADKIPYEDNTFDVVFSSNVLEHLEQPAVVFREIGRVL